MSIETYHPGYSRQAFHFYAEKIRRLEQLADKIENYPKTKKGRAQRKHERMLDREFGSISSQDFNYRLKLIGMCDGIYQDWNRDGMRIVDAAEAIDALRHAASRVPPSFPEGDGLPTMYVHFGDYAPLALKRIPGTVEGVYVRPAQRSDPTVANLKAVLGDMISFPGGQDQFCSHLTLAAVCGRGGTLYPNASLEALILSQSSTVFSRFRDGDFSLISGDVDMINDPAIDLANKMAMCAYMGAMKGKLSPREGASEHSTADSRGN